MAKIQNGGKNQKRFPSVCKHMWRIVSIGLLLLLSDG